MTRSTPTGTARCRATQRGVINAATEIGKTATSAVNPAPWSEIAQHLAQSRFGETAGHEHDGGRAGIAQRMAPPLTRRTCPVTKAAPGADEEAGGVGDVRRRTPASQRRFS